MKYKKKVISANIEQEIIELMDEFEMNRSQTINHVLSRELGNPRIFKERIKEMKDRREELREEKQEIERRIWELDDKIEEMQDDLSRAQAINEARNEIKEKALKSALENVRHAHKNEKVPEAQYQDSGYVAEWKEVPSAEAVINDEAERLSNEFDVSEEAVREILSGYAEESN